MYGVQQSRYIPGMNLHEKVLIQLRDLILRGEFTPGARLAEQQLAVRLKASRTPVRAALVDKDRSPRWQPGSVAEVSPAFVAACFTRAEQEPGWLAQFRPTGH